MGMKDIRKQPIMPIEDRLFYRGRVRSALATRKGINISGFTLYITKGGSYGNKILYKNLKFFDKIFVPSKIS